MNEPGGGSAGGLSARTLLIEDFREVPLGHLLAEPGLTSSAISLPQARMLAVDTLTPEVPRTCREGYTEFRAIHAYKLDRAIVRGGFTIEREGQLTFVQQAGAGYIPALFPAGDAGIVGNPHARRFRCGVPLVVIGHWNMRIYGHFLIEILPKLTAFRVLRKIFPTTRLLLSDYLPPALLAIIHRFVTAEEVLHFDFNHQQIITDALIVIGSPGDDQMIHPWTAEFIATARALAPISAGRPKRLFLSRERWLGGGKAHRQLDNEAAIGAALATRGFVTIHPETLDWAEQVALYGGAEAIVGEFSSALHNALFAPAGTVVIGLNRINAHQEAIAAFAGHRIGFVMPSSGHAVEWGPDVRGEQFSVDPAAVLALVDQAL